MYVLKYIKNIGIFIFCYISASQINAHEHQQKEILQSNGATQKLEVFDPVIKNIEGWNVHIDPKLLSGKNSLEGGKALKMLENHLERISILITGEQLKELRQVEIWIEHSHPELENMQYHPGEKWLTDRGYDKRLNKKVHITQASALLSRSQMLKHPAVILHELAHGYHDQILGFDDARIIDAYKKSMEAKIYDKVLLYNGKTAVAYAATNHKEYFAEAVEAYFYRNDFYPFVRAELKIHDPLIHQLMEEIWGSAK